MQRFKCHKIVFAARIVEVGTAASAVCGYLLLQGHSTSIPMPHPWWDRHKPQAGGYLVQYENGYSAYSPAKAFEEGYHLADDGASYPVRPLRCSCEPEELEQGQQVPTAPRGQKPPTEVATVTHVDTRTYQNTPPAIGGTLTYVLRYDRARHEELEHDHPKLGGRVPKVGDKLMRADDGEERILPPAAPELPTRVTSPALEAMIASITYEIRADGRTTVCELTFKNGFSLRGESSAACVENFRKDLGEELALKEAMDKAWGYAGFMLREDRYRAGLK